MTFLSEVGQYGDKVHLEDVLKARGMTSKELCTLIGITEANLSILRRRQGKGHPLRNDQ